MAYTLLIGINDDVSVDEEVRNEWAKVMDRVTDGHDEDGHKCCPTLRELLVMFDASVSQTECDDLVVQMRDEGGVRLIANALRNSFDEWTPVQLMGVGFESSPSVSGPRVFYV
jgi:hypothetical protein